MKNVLKLIIFSIMMSGCAQNSIIGPNHDRAVPGSENKKQAERAEEGYRLYDSTDTYHEDRHYDSDEQNRWH